MEEDISELVQLVKEARALAEDQLRWIRLGIDDRVEGYKELDNQRIEGIPLVKEIEKYLDSLLSIRDYNLGADDFHRLLDFYKTIDPEAAEAYRLIYNDFF